MTIEIFRRLAGFMLIAILFAGSAEMASAAEKVVLPSGNEIVVDAVGKIYTMEDGKWVLVLKYQTAVPLADEDGLRAEAVEIWGQFFGQMAEAQGMEYAAIAARGEIESSFFGFVETSRTATLVLARGQEGTWRFSDSNEPVSAASGRGVDYARAGEAADERGDRAGAIALYTRALDAGDLSPAVRAGVLANRCRAYIGQGAPGQRAIADCSAAIELQPDMAVAHLNLGNALLQMGDYDRTIHEYSETIRLDPNSAEAYGSRASVYHIVGSYDRALDDLNKAIALAPQAAVLYNNRCDGYRLKGDFRRALADCDVAVRLGATGASRTHLGVSYFTRGQVAEAMGKHGDAARDFKKAYEFAPDIAPIKAKAEDLGLTG